MRNFLRAIAAALRALPRFVTRVVWNGVTWVTALLRDPAPQVEPILPDPVADAPEPVSATTTDVHQIRAIAQRVMDGDPVELELLDGLGDLTVRWLCAQDEWMLERLQAAKDAEIVDHLRNRRTIKGVLRFEPAAIDDLERANAAEHEARVADLIRVHLPPNYYEPYAA